MPPFTDNLAVIVAINSYGPGIPVLRTPVSDGEALADLLRTRFGYEVWLRIDQQATGQALRRLLHDEIPRRLSSEASRLLFYFAGHGVAEENEDLDGPEGFLVPRDAKPDTTTYLPMNELRQAFDRLPCRHFLAILDCCFSGSFRWAATRDVHAPRRHLYEERFRHLLNHPAWQVLTSAADNERALDVPGGRAVGARGEARRHSPFAGALIDGLRGAADRFPDGGNGVISVSELYAYLQATIRACQTPRSWPLPRHGQGEFLFYDPHAPLQLPSAEAEVHLDQSLNPYRGLEAFDRTDHDLFFGRDAAARDLEQQIAASAFTVVVGASGSGKSSLVRAGVLPRLEQRRDGIWRIVGALRPSDDPWSRLATAVTAWLPDAATTVEPKTLADAIRAWLRQSDEHHLVIVIDQLEELITHGVGDETARWERADRAPLLDLFGHLLRDSDSERGRLHIVCTLRSDFEPMFADGVLRDHWASGRWAITPMTQDELRQAIEKPAAERVLFFESVEMVDDLINEVIFMPGALPLLSFTLSQLYLRYLESGRRDRTFTRSDYEQLGGVFGSLRQRANGVYDGLPGDAERATMRRILLRLVSHETGELTRRRVVRRELEHHEAEEQQRVDKVLRRLVEARLVVLGRSLAMAADGGPDDGGTIEPAHDRLVTAWEKVRLWMDRAQPPIEVHRQLTWAGTAWAESGASPGLLWDQHDDLDRLSHWMAEDELSFNALETSFLNASLDQRRRRSRRLLVGTIIALITGFLGVALIRAEGLRTERQRDFAEARLLFAKAREIQGTSRQDEVATQLVLRGHKLADPEPPSTLDALCLGVAEILYRAEAPLRTAFGGEPREPFGTGEQQVRAEAFLRLREILRQPYFSHQLMDDKHVEALVFTPDGQRLISAGVGDYTVDGGRAAVRFWDLSRRPWLSAEQSVARSVVWDSALSLDGRTLYTAGFDELKRWQLEDYRAAPDVLYRADDGPLFALALGPRGKRLAVGHHRGDVTIWNDTARIGQPDIELSGHHGAVRALSFGPDGSTLVSGSEDRRVLLWHLDQKPPRMEELDRHHSEVYSVRLSPDGKWLTSGSRDGTLRLRAVEGELSVEITNPANEESVRAITFSHDGELLAVAGGDRQVRIWQLDRLIAGDVVPSAVLPGHDRSIHALAFSADDRFLASGGADDTVRVWEMQPDSASSGPLVVREFLRQSSEVTQIELCAEQSFFVTAGWSGEVKLWDIDAPEEDGRLLGRHDCPETADCRVRSLALRGDCRLVATGGEDRTVQLWRPHEPKAGSMLLRHDAECHTVFDLDFSPDGHLLAAGCEHRQVELWDVRKPEAPRLLLDERAISDRVPIELVRAVAFHPDGRSLLTGSGDGTILRWDLEALGTPPRTIAELDVTPENRVYELRFNDDGTVLAAGTFDGTVRTWRDLAGDPELRSGHSGKIWSLAFVPSSGRAFDGHVVSASRDKTIRIWDLADPDASSVVLYEHEKEVSDLAIDPSGRYILSVGRDGRIVQSFLPLDNLTDSACRRVWSPMTRDGWRRVLGPWAASMFEPVCSPVDAERRQSP